MNCSVSGGGVCCVSSWMSLLLLRQQLKLAPSDRRWIDVATMQAAKERLAVPKKLLACNTKLKLKIT